ncbi:kinesin-like protein KIN-14L isoform X2 [Cryptomeria japonica]|uniref:kinesin-like protein KIN-14L isoform X2 n=1 Tax=Cryptomeria japonica TaxID=3369 RepID=UPI0025ACABA3|nr:kinesin-like protein KIN-14L isoform X2 [Cryptomeria japonica]
MAASTPDGPVTLASHRRPFAHRRHDSFGDNVIRSGCASNVNTMDEVGRRKAEEAASRRFQAAAWITSMAEPSDMPYEPTEDEFRLCLRNGLILCSLINKVQPGAVPKVVENIPSLCPEGQPLSAYQYFENVRNFLVAVEELKLPTFEASDLEQGSLQPGSTTKIVDCILALKSYHEWKKSGGNGSWKYTGLLKSPMFLRNAGSPQCTSSCMVTKGFENLSNLIDGSMQKNCRQLDLSGCEKPKFVDAVEVKENGPKTGQIQQDDVEQRLTEISHCKDLIGAWLRSFVVGIEDSKENIDRNLSEPLQAATLNGSTETLMNLIFATLKEKQQENNSLIKKIQDQEFWECSNSTESKNDQSKTIQRHLEKNKEFQMRLEVQRKELTDMRVLLQRTKEDLQLMQARHQKQWELLGNEVQRLSIPASGYHRVVEENKNLYNALQDLKGKIRVYCRVRPSHAGDSGLQSTVKFPGEDGSLLIVNTSKTGKDAAKMFNFNKVFGPSATQEEVYLDTQPLIRSVMDGYNVCIFAYGQTGSGKTHTMSGPTGASEKEMGVNYRALSDLFQISQKRKHLTKYEVSVQMIEIYNEQVRDLLGTDASNKKLDIRNNGHNGFNVPDASVLPVNSTSDVLDLMNSGQKNRSVSSTALNDRSSRSHSVLTVHVQGTDCVSGCTLHSCLHLVDLAGSERVDKSEVTGDRLKEAQHINKSLSSLGDVIAALAQKNSHVPYRNSKLTQLLQDSLGGQAKTLMFVHISPELDSYGETLSTLKFAERVATVELGAARVNKESAEVRELKEQVDSLKKALARKEAELGNSQSVKVSPLMFEKHKGKIEKTPVRSSRLSLDGPGRRNTEQLKDGINKMQDHNNISNFGVVSLGEILYTGDKVKLNNTEMQVGKSIGRGNNRRHSLSGKTVELIQTQKANLPPRTPEHPSMGYDISSKSSEQVKSETKTLNVIVTASKKSSNIKKSLQTFGKFMNGSERSQKQVESSSPVSNVNRRFSSGGQNHPSPRRQSLTGVLARRASLTGKLHVESIPIASPQGHIESHCKIPPLQQCLKTHKRWM